MSHCEQFWPLFLCVGLGSLIIVSNLAFGVGLKFPDVSRNSGRCSSRLVKICGHWCKECLKIKKLVKLQGDALKACAKSRNFTVVCIVGGTNLPPTIQTSVKLGDFAEQYQR